MAKVTYLFGAGASAKCLPIVAEIPQRLNGFREFLVHHPVGRQESFSNLRCDFTEAECEEMLKTACTVLIEQTKKHASIDTYAKKLFITGKEKEYRELKAILTCFFIFEQLTHPLDDRYDSFFASILGTAQQDFKGDIRILSWNYDYQFERAYSAYSLSDDLHQNQLMLNVFPGGLNLSHYSDRFSIFKINGTTGFSGVAPMRKSSHLFTDFKTEADSGLTDIFAWYYAALVFCKDHLAPMLSFAWESNNSENNLVNSACKAIAGSKAIVVIGYSFPFFNRDIDKILMSTIDDPNGIKIYIQDKNPQTIIDKLPSVLPLERTRHKIIPIPSYDQFYLPPEL